MAAPPPPVTLMRIHAQDGAFFMGWELCTKLLGGEDDDDGSSLLDRTRWSDGTPGWRVMADDEWAALCAVMGTEADGDFLPILLNTRCLRPVMEQMGLAAALVSALVDPAALTSGTQVWMCEWM
jgi:hypothetical protein